MQGLNRIELLGALTAEPETKQTAGGLAMLAFTLRTTQRYKDKSGAWTERNDEHELAVFGARAEGLGRLLHAGSVVLVEGSLASKPYTDRNGVERRSMTVSVGNVVLVGDGRAPRSSVQPAPRGAQRSLGDSLGDDDVPFG